MRSHPAVGRLPLAVVGDTLLDVDVEGVAERLCPDGPVPVVDIAGQRVRPGGAGLAAVLAADAGHDVRLVTALGGESGALAARLLGAAGVEVVDLGRRLPTPVKRRVLAGGRVVVRLDEHGGHETPASHHDAWLDALGDRRGILVSDYGRGMSADPVGRSALARAGRHVPVVWDPHPSGTEPVDGVTLITPNEREAAAFAATSATGVAGAVAAARVLLDRWPVTAVAVTAGALGAILLDGSGSPFACPAERLDGRLDVSGAGDAFAVGAIGALADRSLPTEAVQLATAAAARFLRAGASEGVGWTAADAGGAAIPVGSEPGPPRRPSTTVATSGCFDLVHSGHVAFLEQARRLGDRLVVLLNDDSSVRRLKGADRPIQRVEDRRTVLEAMHAVDAVEVFDEDTPVEALRRVRPAIFAKGGDYLVADLPETAVLSEWGGTTVTLPYLSGRSTTRLIEEVRHRVHAQP